MTSLVGGLGFQTTQIQRTDLIPASTPASGSTDPVLLDVQVKVTALYNLIVPQSWKLKAMSMRWKLSRMGSLALALAFPLPVMPQAPPTNCYPGRNRRGLPCFILCGGSKH